MYSNNVPTPVIFMQNTPVIQSPVSTQSPGRGTFRDPIETEPYQYPADPLPPVQPPPELQPPSLPIQIPTQSPVSAEFCISLLSRQKQQAEKLKAEAQAIREAREMQYMQQQKELGTRKVHHEIAVAQLGMKKRECEEEIQRLLQAHHLSEVHLSSLKEERDAARAAEEDITRKLEMKIAQLEEQRALARAFEQEEIRRKIHEHTTRQQELALEKLSLDSGRRENEIARREYATMLRDKIFELDQEEKKLHQEWSEIERRRITIENITREAEAAALIGGGESVARIASPVRSPRITTPHYTPQKSPKAERWESSVQVEYSRRDMDDHEQYQMMKTMRSSPSVESRMNSPGSPRPGRSLHQLKADNDFLREKIERFDRQAAAEAAVTRHYERYD
jgi:hypothetical protein